MTNKQIFLSIFFVFILFFSIGAIQAADVNLNQLNASKDVSLHLNEKTQSDDFECVVSDIALTNGSDVPSNETVKNQTQFTKITKNTYFKGKFNAALIDSSTKNKLANKKITFVIDKTKYTAKTNKNGVASINLKLKPGKYGVTAIFKEDKTHKATKITSVFRILPTIKAKNLTKYYKGSKHYTATFFDSYGNYLSNTAVNITVSGKTYTKKTNWKGVATLSKNFKPGTYKVVSTDPITNYKLKTTLKIKPTIKSKGIKNVVGDNRNFSAKFLDGDGKPLSNQYIKFKIMGKTHNAKTDSNGKAIFELKTLKIGTYKIISYNKDGLSKVNTIRIYPIASTKLSTFFYTFLPNENREIKIKLTTSLNDYSNVGRTIKINIDGKNYYKKTDDEGVASFNLKSFKKGFYKVEYEYKGNKFFKTSKTVNYVTILDSKKAKLTFKSTNKFGYGAGTRLKLALTASGVPLVKRTLVLTINGKNYKRITDINGMVSIPIKEKIGDYKVDYRSITKYKVNGTSGSFKIKVFKRSPVKFNWKCGTVFKDDSQTFKVSLTDSKGKPIPGKKVSLTIDSQTYNRKTNSKGLITVKTSVDIGRYRVSLSFDGNNEYLPGSANKVISVKLSKFGNGLNQKNVIHYLGAYVRSSSYCDVNNGQIKSLVNSLTSGLTNRIDKAKAMFNYVRDNVVYEYYYDSHHGSVGTLNAKKGNCVDQAHLLISMYRTAGFKARYVHGTCVFSDGVFGHVWTQVLIGNTWVVGDPISSKNSLGKIKNWNTNNYVIHSKYVSLPF